MRYLLFVVLLVACGDIVKNSNKCCVTQEQCDALGVDDLQPCGSGQICNAENTCESAQCEMNSDCDALSPICRMNNCEATCVAEAECADFSGRTHCASNGACVECTDSSQCSGDNPICDMDDHACRGCERDSDCATGVCLESEGVCAEESALVFVTPGMPDTGQCTRTQPCGTIGYATTIVSTTRNVMRVEAGTVTEAAPIAINKPLKIDGAGTRIIRPVSMPVLQIGTTIASLDVTVEGLNLVGSGELITLGRQANVKFYDMSISQGTFTVNTATVAMFRTSLERTTINCMTGGVRIERSTSLDGTILGDACSVTLRRSSFEATSSNILDVRNGLAIVENNVFMQHDGIADSIYIAPAAAGSTFRFNTVASLDTVDSDGQALFCDASLDVTSNVFSYRSAHPMGFPNGAFCPSTHSLFDNVAVAAHRAGEGNLVAAPSAIFVDRVGRDFHLQPTSEGLGMAETGLGVTEDFEGHVRPSDPDMGALESP